MAFVYTLGTTERTWRTRGRARRAEQPANAGVKRRRSELGALGRGRGARDEQRQPGALGHIGRPRKRSPHGPDRRAGLELGDVADGTFDDGGQRVAEESASCRAQRRRCPRRAAGREEDRIHAAKHAVHPGWRTSMARWSQEQEDCGRLDRLRPDPWPCGRASGLRFCSSRWGHDVARNAIGTGPPTGRQHALAFAPRPDLAASLRRRIPEAPSEHSPVQSKLVRRPALRSCPTRRAASDWAKSELCEETTEHSLVRSACMHQAGRPPPSIVGATSSADSPGCGTRPLERMDSLTCGSATSPRSRTLVPDNRQVEAFAGLQQLAPPRRASRGRGGEWARRWALRPPVELSSRACGRCCPGWCEKAGMQGDV